MYLYLTCILIPGAVSKMTPRPALSARALVPAVRVNSARRRLRHLTHNDARRVPHNGSESWANRAGLFTRAPIVTRGRLITGPRPVRAWHRYKTAATDAGVHISRQIKTQTMEKSRPSLPTGTLRLRPLFASIGERKTMQLATL